MKLANKEIIYRINEFTLGKMFIDDNFSRPINFPLKEFRILII